MRLFVAIGLDGNVKKALAETQELLRKNALSGNFTALENMHLTLVFLGEQSPARLPDITRAMEETHASPFTLSIHGAGRFKRGDGDIWWAGVDKSKPLLTLQAALTKNLSIAGFNIEKRNYSPHLTLAREVKLRPGFDTEKLNQEAKRASCEVSKISLMESSRINGKLTYTEVFALRL